MCWKKRIKIEKKQEVLVEDKSHPYMNKENIEVGDVVYIRRDMVDYNQELWSEIRKTQYWERIGRVEYLESVNNDEWFVYHIKIHGDVNRPHRRCIGVELILIERGN